MNPVSERLECVVAETGSDPVASIVWLHGLGADGHDFEPIVPQLDLGAGRALRFIFPHAPVRPVTINMGVAMRAWFDILGLDRLAEQDEDGIRHGQLQVEWLIADELANGFSADRIVLAGFSQGGALALHTALRYPERLAGIIGLSCYLPLTAQLPGEISEANRATEVFMAHGTFDPVVSPDLGEMTRAELAGLGYEVEWRTYPMAHQICTEEIAALREWLQRIL